ncbi:MAG: DUF7347 domain-containing protein [Candidatus Hodarchaeales archaeon]|jgi:DNA-binding HxlR family transcriptional regulator
MKNTLKIFEILSQPLRFDIVKQLNISRKSFSELLACFEGIKSNVFSFHLKKLVDSELIKKIDKNYELTDFGLVTLNFIEAYESDQTNYILERPEVETEIDPNELSVSTLKTELITLPSRPDGLPPSIRMLNLFRGKEAAYMNEHFSLPLPQPIDQSLHPQTWILQFNKDLNNLSTNIQARKWLEDRLLKLAYGTRGLQDFGLMDASISVPPLGSIISRLQESLLTRGKTGLFAATGMGKSRIMLYLASWWVRKFQAPVLFIEKPQEMTDIEWDTLYQVLLANYSQIEAPRWLIIIEDVHLVSLDTLERIKKLITDAGTQSWSVLIAFTKSAIHRTPQVAIDNREFITSIEYLRIELQPLDMSLDLDLSTTWTEWRPYFVQWVKWVALDILVDLIPWANRSYEPKLMKSYESPWGMVVSLGFLKVALTNLKNSVIDNIFPLVLYALLSQLYILRGEKDIKLSNLLTFLRLVLANELSELYQRSAWEDEVRGLIIHWTDPVIRLLPPLKYLSTTESLKKEKVISFYHQEWAQQVCKFLIHTETNDVYPIALKVFKTLIPSVYSIWTKIQHKEQEFEVDFLSWLRENSRFELNDAGQLLIVHLKLVPSQIEHLEEFSLNEIQIDQLNQDQLLNWTFIKKVVSNYQTYPGI